MIQMIMKGIVCLQVYKGVLEAILFSTEAGQERGSLGLSKRHQLCQAWGETSQNPGERFVLAEPSREASDSVVEAYIKLLQLRK